MSRVNNSFSGSGFNVRRTAHIGFHRGSMKIIDGGDWSQHPGRLHLRQNSRASWPDRAAVGNGPHGGSAIRQRSGRDDRRSWGANDRAVGGSRTAHPADVYGTGTGQQQMSRSEHRARAAGTTATGSANASGARYGTTAIGAAIPRGHAGRRKLGDNSCLRHRGT